MSKLFTASGVVEAEMAGDSGRMQSDGSRAQQLPLAAVQKKNSTSTAASKASQQRYTSDDLYKPRHILLGSRSRRRAGLDSGEM